VVAVQEEPPGDWRDPAALEALARVATQVTIVEGEHKTIDLRVREVRQ
jgi:16S rRNA G966 N2-methylase RsmD